MDIGLIRESTPGEHRVPLVPAQVAELIAAGHRVYFEPDAGRPAGIGDGDYVAAGAIVEGERDLLYRRCGVLLRSATPSREECEMLRPDHLVGAFYAFGADLSRLELMRRAGALCLSYESLRVGPRRPVAEAADAVTGRVAAREGLALARVGSARVVVLGPGRDGCAVAAHAAAGAAVEAGARVTLLDGDGPRVELANAALPGVDVRLDSPGALRTLLSDADLLIAAARATGGGRAPVAVDRETIGSMREGAVVVDVAADQGCCVATSRPTTLAHPTATVGGVVHHALPVLGGLGAAEASAAISAALTPFVLRLAQSGFRRAITEDEGLAAGLTVVRGHVTRPEIAQAFGMPCAAVESALR